MTTLLNIADKQAQAAAIAAQLAEYQANGGRVLTVTKDTVIPPQPKAKPKKETAMLNAAKPRTVESTRDANGTPTIPAVGLIRLKDLLPFLPCCKTTLLTWVKQGKFPEPVKLSTGMVAWDCQKVHAWLKKLSEQL